jgi:hypothetical protein
MFAGIDIAALNIWLRNEENSALLIRLLARWIARESAWAFCHT